MRKSREKWNEENKREMERGKQERNGMRKTREKCDEENKGEME